MARASAEMRGNWVRVQSVFIEEVKVDERAQSSTRLPTLPFEVVGVLQTEVSPRPQTMQCRQQLRVQEVQTTLQRQASTPTRGYLRISQL